MITKKENGSLYITINKKELPKDKYKFYSLINTFNFTCIHEKRNEDEYLHFQFNAEDESVVLSLFDIYGINKI